MRLWRAITWLCVWSVAAPASAQATPSAEPTTEAVDDEYSALIKKALAEFQLGHWLEAKAFFARAHARRPSARTLRGLGLAAYELRSYVESLRFLRAALASTEHPLTDAMRSEVSAAIRDAETFVAIVHLSFKPAGTLAKVWVDDRPVELDHDLLYLEVGRRHLLFRADGFDEYESHLVAEPGARIELPIEFVAISSAPATTEATPTPARDPTFWSSLSVTQTVGLATGSAGVIAVGVGAVFGALAITAKNESAEHCVGNSCEPKGVTLRNQAFDHARIANIGFVAGGVLLGTGLTLVLLGGESETEAHASLRAAPGGAVLRASW